MPTVDPMAELRAAGKRRQVADKERHEAARALEKAVKRAAKAGMRQVDIACEAGISREAVRLIMRGQR
jgi:hypothetical protein